MFNDVKIREFQKHNAEQVLLLCQDNAERIPLFNMVYAVVAEQEDKIIGFSAVGENYMIEPLVANKSMSNLMRAWVKVELLRAIKSRLSELNISKVMFTTEDEHLVKFMNKRFDICLYTREPLYIVNL